MIITGREPVAIVSLKRHLHFEFEMKDLGFLLYFLGIVVAYSSRDYLLSQQKYFANLFACATLSYPATPTSSSSTPMELHLKLRRDDGTHYRSLHNTGNWWVPLYLSATRPDISQAVYVLSQFVSAPTSVHYATLFSVLRYF